MTKSPPTSYMIREKLGLEKGSTHPGAKVVGRLSRGQIREIASAKHEDQHLRHIPFEGLCNSIAGTAASMGIDIVEDEPPESDAETPTSSSASEV